jgi:outer membrane protein, heavy metal efflux system
MGAMGAIGAMMLVFGVADAHAQAPADLSLEQAVKMALEREPSLRAARAELDVARGLRRQAGLRPNPSLSLELREEPAGADNQTMVQVSLPLDLFRRTSRIEAADREIDVVDTSVSDRARVLTNEVKRQYGEVAAAVRDRGITDDLAASARRALELLRRRVDEGASPPLERDLLDVEVRRFDSARLLAAGRADAAMFGLKRTLGLTAGTPLTLRDTLEALSPLSAPPDTGALPGRPDVREAEARVRLADARIDQAQSDGRLDVSVFGSYVRMTAGFPQRGFSASGELERVHGTFNYVSGGAMLTLPVWNRNQGLIDVARANRSVAVARLEAVRLAAEAERAAALVQATQARGALELIAGSVRLARQNLDVVRQTYELGRGTLGDVLAEQRRYLEIEREYTATLHGAFEARVSLEFAQGEVP